jgi:hypothetical protein
LDHFFSQGNREGFHHLVFAVAFEPSMALLIGLRAECALASVYGRNLEAYLFRGGSICSLRRIVSRLEFGCHFRAPTRVGICEFAGSHI